MSFYGNDKLFGGFKRNEQNKQLENLVQFMRAPIGLARRSKVIALENMARRLTARVNKQ